MSDLSPLGQELLGQAMLALAKAEGHRPGFPNTGHMQFTPPEPQMAPIKDILRMKAKGMDHRTIAAHFGCSPSTITRRVRMHEGRPG